MRTEPLGTRDPRGVGPWQLVGRIGSGGMGVVYLGRRTVRGRTQEAAVKVVPEYLLGRGSALARFRREIAVLISLEDPGVARIVAADLDEDPPWYAADLIDGPTLAHQIQAEGPLAPDLWPSLALTLISTLTRLHSRGIIHRDLKPHNVVLGPHGPVIIDFGISAVVGSTSLTSTGDSPRTELWASPEQLRNEEATTATDVFATATLLAWAATGTHPFAPSGEYHREGLIAAILTAEPVLDGVPAGARGWLEQMLAKAPKDRPTALDLMESLTDLSPADAIRLARAAQDHGWTAAARAWWQLAADAGLPEAFLELGNLAAADADPAAARSWWRLAAGAGHPEVAQRADESIAALAIADLTSVDSAGGVPDSTRAAIGSSSPAAVPVAAIPGAAGPVLGLTAEVAHDGAAAPARVGSRSGRRRVRAPAALAAGLIVLVLALWLPGHFGAGSGDDGAVDTPAGSTRPVPVALSGSGPQSQVQKVAVGTTSACVITEDWMARCWGSNASGQLGSPGGDADVPRAVSSSELEGAELSRITVGESHACALDREGRPYCWGSNSEGQLGIDKSTLSSSDRPVRPDPGGVLADKTIDFIGAAGASTCALDDAGILYCWGVNTRGQLGDGSRTSTHLPVPVDTSGALRGHRLRRFGVGGDHTCAIDEQGAVYCWGANDHGQLGDGTHAVSLVPVRVHPPQNAPEEAYDAVNLGSTTTCARTVSGYAVCWGDNGHGQIGIGPRSGPSPDEPLPMRVPSDSAARPIIHVAVSGPTVCSTSEEGLAFCWGDNSSGQLGNGTTQDASLPEAVVDPVDEVLPPLPLVAAGPITSCGVAADGRTWCWGSDQYGLLGNGTS